LGRGYSDLCDKLREYLRSQKLQIGDQIPGERELATALGAGRTALRPCIDQLVLEGVLEKRPQSGTFLLRIPPALVTDVTIALIAPFSGTEGPVQQTDAVWLHRVVSAFERTTRLAGVKLILKDQSPLSSDPCSVKELARQVIADGVRAAVLLHPTGPKDKISCALALLHDFGIHPVIVSSRTYPGLASRVYFDSGWGAYLATRYLLQKGHQRIGFAGAPEGPVWMTERFEGFREALATAEIPLESSSVYYLDQHLPPGERQPTLKDGADALRYFLTLPESERPTALFAANDSIALGILRSAAMHGISIPDSLSLIGFDNDPGALSAGLTTIERPTEALGEAIAQVTLERVAAGQEAATVTQRLRPVLLERGTVIAPQSSGNLSNAKEQL
jgi:DNA-binding LacI/PurR family transcriptional regulator/biotin operon repressor